MSKVAAQSETDRAGCEYVYAADKSIKMSSSDKRL